MTREEIINNLLYMKRSVREDTIEDMTINEAIKALEQEPCDDAISRQAVLSHIRTERGNGHEQPFDYVEVDVIKQLPPVTPMEKVGQWIYDDDCREHGHCSECGYGSVDLVDGKPHNYCSNCGRKMEVQNADSD